MTPKVNDIVRFLNDVGGGRVTHIKGNMVYVEDSDGFERPVPASQVVVVQQPATYERPIEVRPQVVPDKPAAKPEPVLAPVEETPEGDQLNIVLCYRPRELQHLTTTTFFPVLVNDSNYYLYFAYLTRGDDDNGEWTTRYHGQIEPNTLIDLDEFGRDDLNSMTHVAVQYVAYKEGKPFKLKNPALVEHRLDVSKFYKLHCFHKTDYGDSPMLTIEITRNDRPTRDMHIDSGEIETAMNGGNRVPKGGGRGPKISKPSPKPGNELIVKDLHIHELLDNTAGLSNADMLRYQLEKFNEVMQANLKNIGQRIVFIHGKGEGVLRKAIYDELRRRYPQCTFHDASFREYGFGATEVVIHQR